MKEIVGYWNIYRCLDCEVDFAISQETDDDISINCPHCSSTENVEYTGTNFIER